MGFYRIQSGDLNKKVFAFTRNAALKKALKKHDGSLGLIISIRKDKDEDFSDNQYFRETVSTLKSFGWEVK